MQGSGLGARDAETCVRRVLEPQDFAPSAEALGKNAVLEGPGSLVGQPGARWVPDPQSVSPGSPCSVSVRA